MAAVTPMAEMIGETNLMILGEELKQLGAICTVTLPGRWIGKRMSRTFDRIGEILRSRRQHPPDAIGYLSPHAQDHIGKRRAEVKSYGEWYEETGWLNENEGDMVCVA